MHFDPNQIDLSEYTSALSVSSQDPGAVRWTEIEIFHNPDAHGRARWICEVRGVSTVEGERTRLTRVAGGTIERVARMIDGGTNLGRKALIAIEDYNDEQAR